MPNPLMTIFTQLQADIVDAHNLSSDVIFSQETTVPPDVLPYAIITLAPFEIKEQTPLNDTSEEIKWSILTVFPVSAAGGQKFLEFQINMFNNLRSKLTTSAAYAGLGYLPKVSQFDPTQSSDVEQETIEVALMFTHCLDFPRG